MRLHFQNHNLGKLENYFVTIKRLTGRVISYNEIKATECRTFMTERVLTESYAACLNELIVQIWLTIVGRNIFKIYVK